MLHLLLIEDNAADVLLIREALRSSPFSADVLVASDGEEALSILGEFAAKPDLIILDLNLPQFDGHAILERYNATIGAPVVVFSGSANEEDRRRALANGAKDYFVKPTQFEPYIAAVHQMIERWGQATQSASP